MIGGQKMNGIGHAPTNNGGELYDGERALIRISPINLSGAQLWGVIAAIFGAAWSAYIGGALFLPAKDSDLKALTAVVQQLSGAQQQAQKEAAERAREAAERGQRLTVALDNLSAVVENLKNAPPRTIERYLPRPVTQRAAPAARRAATP